jgi:aspartyl-tRNA(Asn)/glutamyl-tRNA(Gln) amidotransferase subunit B
VEIKNLNSIRFIKKAIEYESQRLITLHQKGEEILQQTRGFDESNFSTYAIRTKEDEDDYRYFPEPDLPPFLITNEQIESIRSAMPPLQEEIKAKLLEDYQLSAYDAQQIADDSDLTQFFFDITEGTTNYKAAANWTIGPVRNYLASNDLSLDDLAIPASSIALIIRLIEEGKINYGIATQKIFSQLVNDPTMDIIQYIEENGLGLEQSQDEIDGLIEKALTKHAEKITEYKKGKKGLISLFVGEVMKLSKGKADAKLVTEKIIEQLKTR